VTDIEIVIIDDEFAASLPALADKQCRTPWASAVPEPTKGADLVRSNPVMV
jgi:hypothetical protein